MDNTRDLTPIETAVVAMLKKPAKIPAADLQSDFVIRAFSDPSELVQIVFNACDWDAIAEHVGGAS
jgi:hypothetical protein